MSFVEGKRPKMNLYNTKGYIQNILFILTTCKISVGQFMFLAKYLYPFSVLKYLKCSWWINMAFKMNYSDEIRTDKITWYEFLSPILGMDLST